MWRCKRCGCERFKLVTFQTNVYNEIELNKNKVLQNRNLLKAKYTEEFMCDKCKMISEDIEEIAEWRD